MAVVQALAELFLVNFMAFIVEHHVNECIGCSACATVSPESFKMVGDKAHLINGKNSNSIETIQIPEIANSQEAADVCPVPCIFIKKID